LARVLLVGCGDIGSGLATVLVAQGHQVSAVKRTAPQRALPGVSYLICDITQPDQVQRIPCEVDQVFVILAPGERTENHYQALFIVGLSNLLHHFANSPEARSTLQGATPHWPHWIFVSSTSVYGQHGGEWVDEKSPTLPQGFNGRCLLQAEKLLHEHDASATVVRFSGIYGPDRSGLVQSVLQGKPVQYLPSYYTNRIHAEDCVHLLAHLLAQRLAGAVLEACYVASDNTPASLREVVTWLAQQLGCAVPPATAATAHSRGQNKRCCNKQIIGLGYQFRHSDYRSGYRDIINAYSG